MRLLLENHDIILLCMYCNFSSFSKNCSGNLQNEAFIGKILLSAPT